MGLTVGKCFLINLKRRADRLLHFRKLQKENGWHLPEPEIFNAIDGDKVGVPTSFKQGGGAFGCRQSHISCLERCVNEDVQSVLMLEDDVTWNGEAWKQLDIFMQEVPKDWSYLLLGGQHCVPSKPVSKHVHIATNTQRTHAYIVRGECIKALLGVFYTCNVHIDWQAGAFQQKGKYKCYAPEPFIFGQTESRSDISGRTNPTNFWSSDGLNLTPDRLLIYRGPRSVKTELRNFHAGNFLHSSGLDNGLINISTLSGVERHQELQKWIELVGREAANSKRTLMIWHPNITFDEVKKATDKHVIEIKAETVEEVMKEWNANTLVES